MNVKNNYPKVWEKYKEWQTNNLKEQYGEHNYPEIPDNLIELSISKSPMSLCYFFDQHDLIGSVCYNGLETRFELSINGIAIEEEDPDIDHIMKGAKDRKKAETILIKYLMSEMEKTL